MRLSARGYTRVLRVARTVADLAESEKVGRVHVAEALSYRGRSAASFSARHRRRPDPAAGAFPAGKCAGHRRPGLSDRRRSEEHTSELQSLMRISYAVFCLKKK